VTVRLVSGQCPADYAARTDNLAHGFGAHLCRVRTARPGRITLELVLNDAEDSDGPGVAGAFSVPMVQGDHRQGGACSSAAAACRACEGPPGDLVAEFREGRG